MIGFTRCCVVCLACCWSVLAAFASPRVEHVFVISIDGGNPEVIQRSKMPVLKKLMKEGACTSVARTIMPPLTLPAHASMLTGVETNKHKITWNNYSLTNGVVEAPTIFSVARRAGFSTAMFVGKEKFRHLVEPGAVDEFSFNAPAAVVIAKDESGGTDKKKEGNVFAKVVAQDAADYIIKHKPNLCFIHFTDPDSIGHEYGWGSPEQLAAFADTDAGLGIFLQALRKARLASKSVIIISADHGGHEKGHGKGTEADMRIPWIAWGKGVRSRHKISEPVYTCDTAATVLWLLNLEPAMPLDGKPIVGAFK